MSRGDPHPTKCPPLGLPKACHFCERADCTVENSPHCFCLDCGTRLEPCRCRPDCRGGNCYQPNGHCSEAPFPADSLEKM